MNLNELYEIREKLKKSIDSLAKGWASSRPDVSTNATSKIPHSAHPANRPHVRSDTQKPLTYDTSEEHSKLTKATTFSISEQVEKSLHPDEDEADVLNNQNVEAAQKGKALAKAVAKPEQLPTKPDLVTVASTEDHAHKLNWKTKDVVLNKNQPKPKSQWHVKIKGLDGYHPVKTIIPPKAGGVANVYHLEDGRKLHQKEIEDLRM